MILVYVAGPFSAPTREGVEANIRRAELLGVEVARLGAFPVVPHANTSHPAYEEVQPYDFWIAGTMALLERCHAILLAEDYERSSGARGERDHARRLGMPVFYGVEEFAEWLRAHGRTDPAPSNEDDRITQVESIALSRGTVSAPNWEDTK